MKPDQRVMLDRRIAEEGMHELDPHGSPPAWRNEFDGWQPNAFTMDVTGAVSPRWVLLDEVDWTDVVAVRIERNWGAPINIDDLMRDDGDLDFWP